MDKDELARDDRYRNAARTLAAVKYQNGVEVLVSGVATVTPLNSAGFADLGDGAFVEASIWIPAREVEA